MFKVHQCGGGKCKFCGSSGTNASSCPLNPNSISKNPKKHPLATQTVQHGQPVSKKGKINAAQQDEQQLPPVRIKFKVPRKKPHKSHVAQQDDEQQLPPVQINKPKVPWKKNKPTKPKPTKPKPVKPKPVKPRCNNLYTLLGDDVKDIPQNKLYVSPYGNCFNVSEDLFPHFMNGNNTDPYTSQPLWRNGEERNAIINHPGWEPNERAELARLLLAPIDYDILKNNSSLFEKIFNAGYIMFSDYTKTFALSSNIVNKTLTELTNAGDVGEKILNVRERGFDNPQTLREILKGSANSCIHGVGIRLMKFYLDLWHMMPQDAADEKRPNLPREIHHDTDIDDENIKKYAKIIACQTTDNRQFFMLYIYDWINGGQESHLWYFLDTDGTKLIQHIGNPLYEPLPEHMQIIYGKLYEKYRTVISSDNNILGLIRKATYDGWERIKKNR